MEPDFKQIRTEHVIAALSDLDGGRRPESYDDSTTHDLVHEGKAYPPKMVAAIALEKAVGLLPKSADFIGGTDKPCFKALKSLGFSIVPKASTWRLRTIPESYPDIGRPDAYYWQFAVGKIGKYNSAQECIKRGEIMMQSSAKGSLEDQRHKLEGKLSSHQDGMLFNFAFAMCVGDVVMLYNDFDRSMDAVGVVTSEYIYDPSQGAFPHIRKVKWVGTTKTIFEVAKGKKGFLARKPLTPMLTGWDFSRIITETLTMNKLPIPGNLRNFRKPLGATPETFKFDKAWGTQDAPQPRLQILYGPPGTGKTYRTSEAAYNVMTGSESPKKGLGGRKFAKMLGAVAEAKQRRNIVFITFHQNYDYSDFIEGYKPKKNEGGQLNYDLMDGVLKRMVKDAIKWPREPFVLIIDEINRGNISQIFGELITLIEPDKRQGAKNEISATLPLSGERFCLPPNLSIIGTMNNADRSIALLDTALRRRFDFVKMPPNPEVLKKNGEPKLAELLTKINSLLEKSGTLSPDHRIGHAWLMGTQGNAKEFKRVLEQKILPLLEEWFYGSEGSESGAALEEIKQLLFTPGSLSDGASPAAKNLADILKPTDERPKKKAVQNKKSPA